MSNKTYQVNEAVSCVDEGADGAMLYDPDRDDTVLLNAAGRSIWALLAVPRTMTEIAGHLTATYPGLPYEQALKDAQAFIGTLAPGFIITIPDES